jgi:hypothetical protein
MFLFSDYWPKPKVGELTVFDFGLGADNLPYSFIMWSKGDGSHYYQEDYHNNKWQSTWYLNYFDKRGILETADDYPKRSYQWWTSYRTVAFSKGKDIIWGGVQDIGDVIEAPCVIDAIRSTKFEAPKVGNQKVSFIKHHDSFTTFDKKFSYKDVVQIAYDQTWDGKTTGWRAWHAKGIGIVQIVWRYNGNDVGNPISATVTTVKGKIVNKYPVLT